MCPNKMLRTRMNTSDRCSYLWYPAVCVGARAVQTYKPQPAENTNYMTCITKKKCPTANHPKVLSLSFLQFQASRWSLSMHDTFSCFQTLIITFSHHANVPTFCELNANHGSVVMDQALGAADKPLQKNSVNFLSVLLHCC